MNPQPFSSLSRIGRITALIFTSGLLMFTGCKSDKNTEALEAEKQRADSLLRASIENRKRLETEEELAERVRRIKNKTFSSRDSIYFEAEVIPTHDSLLAGIELRGKASTKGKISTFSQTALTLDGQIVKGVLPGKLFKTEKSGANHYSLYTLDQETGRVEAFQLFHNNDSVSVETATVRGNYFFDLLTQREFQSTPENPVRFFKTIKASRVEDRFPADSTAPYLLWYRDRRPLFPKYLETPVQRYWRRSPVEISNLILTGSTDSTAQAIVLSSERRTAKATIRTSSAFINDSVFQQYRVRDSLVYDHQHLVVYQKDSVTLEYGYNNNFEFTLRKSDSVRVIENYPQKYEELKDSIFELETSAFNMNDRQVHWKYLATYLNNDLTEEEVILRINQKDLVDHLSRELIFRLPGTGIPARAPITALLNQEHPYKAEDLNFDGYTDFSFPKGTDNNGNPEYIVYLYTPQYGRFSRTQRLDGKSIFKGIVTDTIHKRLLYPGNIGNGHLSVSILYPNQTENPEKEVFWTTGNNRSPQVHYQKMVNNRVTEKHSPLLDSLPVIKDLRTSLLTWIMQQG